MGQAPHSDRSRSVFECSWPIITESLQGVRNRSRYTEKEGKWNLGPSGPPSANKSNTRKLTGSEEFQDNKKKRHQEWKEKIAGSSGELRKHLTEKKVFSLRRGEGSQPTCGRERAGNEMFLRDGRTEKETRESMVLE